jgi:hypothetical protein
MNEEKNEPTTIGLNEVANSMLGEIKEYGLFDQGIDIYKFAIGLAISRGGISSSSESRTTIYNTHSIDPNREIYNIIKYLGLEKGESVYKCAERLAEWGIGELHGSIKGGKIDYQALLGDK